jgi:hypothetical protein
VSLLSSGGLPFWFPESLLTATCDGDATESPVCLLLSLWRSWPFWLLPSFSWRVGEARGVSWVSWFGPCFLFPLPFWFPESLLTATCDGDASSYL